MKAYHGTSKESMESILNRGFELNFAGRNGDHFGKGIYVALTKKKAKVYGKHIVTVELDKSRLFEVKDWFLKYKEDCDYAYKKGVPNDKVNSYVGEQYRQYYIQRGYTGIILDSITGSRGKEIVIYDPTIIKSISM